MQSDYLKPELENTSVRIPGYVVIFFCCIIILTEFFRTLPGPVWLGDLGSFIESGWAATVRLNPYGIYPHSLHSVLPGYEFWNPNMNPPISVILFRLFTFARPEVVFRQWYLISLCCYAGITWMMINRFPQVPRRVVIVWMFSLASLWETLALGQIYVPLMGLGIIGWLQLEKKRLVPAGICIGILIAIKPQFLLWPCFLILARHYRAPIVALITAALLWLVPLLMYGPTIYGQWFKMLSESTAQRLPFITNISLSGLFGRMGMTRFGFMLGVGLCIALCIWAAWKRPSIMRASSFGVIAAFLTAPIAWMAYDMILIPLLLSRWRDERIRFVAFSLCVPIPMILSALSLSNWAQFTLGSIYNWSIILLLVLISIEEYGVLLRGEEGDQTIVKGAKAV